MNIRTLAILTIVVLALTAPLSSAADWQQFHCDIAHTGHSTSNAPDTNNTAWISEDIGADFPSSVTVADGQVFVYCGAHLVSLDEYTGAVLWNVSVNETPNVCGSWVTPAYHDGRVFLSANETCCFDAADGSLIWTFTPPTGKGAVNGGCTIVENMVFTSDWDGNHYYCLNVADGTEVWNFTVDGNAQSTPAVSVADDRVFFGSYANICEDGGVAYCVNMTTGDEIWNFTTDNSVCGSVTIGDGVVYFTEYNFYGDGALYALYSENGTVKWNKTVERSDSTPALVDGRLYISGGYGGIQNKDTDLLTYCFDASTGDLTWNTSVADEIGDWKCSPACADGMVFAGRPKPNSMEFEGTYALNASTGEIVWSYPEGGASPAVADGMVFTVGGGRVYAFGPTTIWNGDVTLGSGTFNVTADDSGKEYAINRTCALAALIRAAEAGGFNYTISDSWYEDYGSIQVKSIAGRENDPVTWAGWCYWVNYPEDPVPTVGGNKFELSDGDVVTWYYGEMGSAPNNTDMLIRIGTSYDYWNGDVALGSGTFNVTAESGVEYTINRTCALASIIGAARVGGLDYTINDSWYESYGTIYIAEIDGVSDWMYWVNYPDDPSPMVGSNAYELADGDVVTWYHADSMESTPEKTDMLIRIRTSYDYWNGDVALGSGTFNVTAESGVEYTINRTCALASIIGAAKVGGLDYTINDSWYESYGTIYIAEIDGVSDWMYWVNYPDDPSPIVGSNAYELADGDAVVWYHADSMESTPEKTDMLIRIRTSYDYWNGDVALGSGTFNVTAESGVEYTINRTCALASIIGAARVGGLDYTINDSWYESYGTIYIAEIDGVSDWMYWVNYPDDPSPMVGSNAYELADGDVVTWYHADSMESTPEKTDMLIRIGTSYDYWNGDVALGSGTFNVTAESGVEYTINRTCALASIIGAARVGGLDYTINDSWYESYGTIYVAEIDGVSDWMYWVNYPNNPSPMVGSNAYELADGDVVTWYHADSMESTPEKTDMLIRIETSYDYWNGDVALGSGTFNVTADNSGKEYTINRTCALASIIRAAEEGGFDYTINDSWYESYGSLRPDSVAGKSEVGWDGWLYWVNYPDDPSPSCTADHFELNDSDVVTWYYGGMGASPDNTDMLIRIGVSLTGTTIPGDVNHDGSVTTADAMLALRMAVGSVAPNDAADVNSDGAVTSLDALMIRQAAAGANIA